MERKDEVGSILIKSKICFVNYDMVYWVFYEKEECLQS